MNHLHRRSQQSVLDQNAIDACRNADIAPQTLLIDGKATAARSGDSVTVTSPIDGTELTSIALADAADVDQAVRSARDVFERGSWSRMAPAERKKIMLRWAELVSAEAVSLAVLGSRDNGTEISMSFRAEPIGAAKTIQYYAEAIDKVYGEIAPSADDTVGLIQREPVGVVGVIVPWNFPLSIGTWKIAPALASGNSVVVKPPEIASLSLLRLAELALEAGIPPGTLNVVTGSGRVAGEALALHNEVDVIAFTGSGAVGRRLLEYSARSNLKRVYLELGGKSPNVVFNDVSDMDAVVNACAKAVFRNSGQVCIAATRLIVQDDIADTFVQKLTDAAESLIVGDPLSLNSDVGAVASKQQLAGICSFVQTAKDEGAELVTGGSVLHEESGGCYMEPTVFTNVSPEMTIAREEVFGPVLSVFRFKDKEEAVRLANSTDYGLAAGVWTSNLNTAHQMIRNVRSGTVHVNCYGGTELTVPMGGVKQSGNSHDKSLHALENYTNLKTAWMKLTADSP